MKQVATQGPQPDLSTPTLPRDGILHELIHDGPAHFHGISIPGELARPESLQTSDAVPDSMHKGDLHLICMHKFENWF